MKLSEPMSSKKIFIIYDCPIIVDGLKSLVTSDRPNWQVEGTDDVLSTAIGKIEVMVPDMVIMKIFHRGVNTLEAIRDLKQSLVGIKILIFGENEEMWYRHALKAGISGYLSTSARPPEVMRTIIRVLCGEVIVSPDHLREFCRLPNGRSFGGNEKSLGKLSNRELEIFVLIGHGFSSDQMASRLEVSIKTIETHRNHIRKKLDLDFEQLVLYAITSTAKHF